MINDKNPTVAVKNELCKIDQIKNALADDGCLYDEKGDVDYSFLLDMIEGETNLHEMLLALEEKVAEYGMMQEAILLHIEMLTKRKNRIKKSSDSLRTIILSAMDRAGIQKIEGALATLSIRNTPRNLVVTDESLIPSEYFELKPKLDKKKLLEALKDGENIGGVELDNGGITLMIRRL